MSTDQPVERKVKGATIGAGAGAIIASFVNWGLSALFWQGPEGVPEPVQSFVLLLVTVGLTFLGGYYTKSEV